LRNMISKSDVSLFNVESVIKPWTNFKHVWEFPRDDNMFLVGIAKYGYGQWEKISQELQLNLQSKINLSNLPSPLPSPSHLNIRTEALFKSLRECHFHIPAVIPESKITPPKQPKLKIPVKKTEPSATPTSTPTRTLKIRPIFKLTTKETDKVVNNDPMETTEKQNVVVDRDQKTHEASLRSKCESEITSLSDLLENLKQGLRDSQDKSEKVRLNKQLVLTIGNKIEDIIQTLVKEKLSEDFIEGLWDFAGRLYTKKPGSDLKRFYYHFKKS